MVLLTALCLAASCSKFDDSKIWEKINGLSNDIATLQAQSDALNSELSTIKAIVTALQDQDYITNVAPLADGSGYTITFAKLGAVVIKNGEKGATGNTPKMGVKKDTDGIYYWTIDGEWLLDNGDKIVAEGKTGQEGVTPKLKIENDYWYVSYDNGASWQQLGKAKGDEGAQGPQGDSLFQSIDTSDPENVVIFLSDGTVFVIPKNINYSAAVALDENGTSNCYIVSEAGRYKFPTVKGNSNESVGEVASVEVLWETFNTDTAPAVGDLIKKVSFVSDYVYFEASNKRGNALIAAKDVEGKTLWSWHIWMTDQPVDQVYYNNAGTMMDRNLGATITRPLDNNSTGFGRFCGLYYQWGRKDPFIGVGDDLTCLNPDYSIEKFNKAKSTKSWPNDINFYEEPQNQDFVQYSVENPMVFISGWIDVHSINFSPDLWNSQKTIYDPCPPGYRIPDGNTDGIWARASGQQNFVANCEGDAKLYVNYKGFFSDEDIYYPIAGFLHIDRGDLCEVGSFTYQWSCSRYYSAPGKYYGYIYGRFFGIHNGGTSTNGSDPLHGGPVRCCKE